VKPENGREDERVRVAAALACISERRSTTQNPNC